MAALLQFTGMGRGPIVGASRSTAWQLGARGGKAGRSPWAHLRRVVALGPIPSGIQLCSGICFWHGVPINYVSRWLGHRSIQTTLIYLELVPDPVGRLAMVP